METFRLDIDNLDTENYLKFKLREFTHYCLDRQFHEIPAEGTDLLNIPLLHEEFLRQGVKPEQLSRPSKKMFNLGSSLALELTLGPDFHFRFYKDGKKTLIIWQQQDIGLTESGVCSLGSPRRSGSYITPTIAEYRLSERQMAAFLLKFVKTYPKEVKEVFDKKVFEAQKRKSRRQMDRTAISALVEERLRPLQLEYMISEQCYRSCVQIRLNRFTQLILYIPYKKFRESIDQQFQAIDKLQEGLSLLNSQACIRACSSYLPWVKPEVTEEEEIIEI